MKRNKEKQRRKRQLVKGGTTRLISPKKLSADLEEPKSHQTIAPHNGSGVLRPDLDTLRVPDALIEASDAKASDLIPGSFMLTIMGLAIVFIATIAWFVSQMPDR
jgi:hypothetical protein